MKRHRNSQNHQNHSSQNPGGQSQGMREHGQQAHGQQGFGQQGFGNQAYGNQGGRRSGGGANGYGERNWEDDAFEARNQGFRGGSGSDWTEGRYAGRGPKGYTRSDERIKEEISEELTAHGGVDASNCTVEVSEGEVTLEGDVESREMKRMIEDVADGCSGVTQVHNRLRVRGNGEDSGRGSRSGASSSQGDGDTSSYSSSSKRGSSSQSARS